MSFVLYLHLTVTMYFHCQQPISMHVYLCTAKHLTKYVHVLHVLQDITFY